MRIQSIVPVLALGALLGLGSAGCSKALQHTTLLNQPPTVSLTWAPITSDTKVFYLYKLNWVGYDSDGRVVRFEYAVDPPRTDGGLVDWDRATQKQSTTKNEETIRFAATQPESNFINQSVPKTEDPHIFAVRAIDNLGAASETVERAFFSFGVAPVILNMNPQPQKLLVPKVTPAVRINWQGKDFIDPYGYAFEKPLYYKYTIYKKGNPGVHWIEWLQEPDSLRREVAPAFAGWDSTGPENPEVQYTNLTVEGDYLFVVVAFGRSGAYSPVFKLAGQDANMLQMKVKLAGLGGPTITLFNSFFNYTYPGGGFSLDPSRAIQLQVPAATPITFNWVAMPSEGSLMKDYRWVLDLVALDDETARTNQDDIYHWSTWNGDLSATLPPFTGSEGDEGELHNFYLEARDINGLVSLGWVQYRVYRPTFDRDLLVVNDTRFQVDQLAATQPAGRTDSLRAPFGVWPSRAELDTFLFAVGGMPWRMKTPWMRLSPAGVFKGYSFDTLGTRYGLAIPTVALGLLGHYNHIVWMTDKSDGYGLNPNSNTLPVATIVYMSAPGRQNTLATWVSQGGKLWSMGGGFGHATNKLWNKTGNDANSVRTYKYEDPATANTDLLPGRFMYDLAHWRSEFRLYGPAFVRVARYDQPDPYAGTPKPPSYWKGGIFTNPEVDYAHSILPTALQFRDQTSDPIWPNRSVGEFYIGNRALSGSGVNLEFISFENRVLETLPAPTPTDPDATVERSTLDTLYNAFATSYPKQMNISTNGEGLNVIMTYYHGADSAPLVHTGMAMWDFRRQDCQNVVDFVLGTLWGLHKNTYYVNAPSAARLGATQRTVSPGSSAARGTSFTSQQPARKSPSLLWR